VDFYVGVLGLRLIKQTVNYDDPGTYHLYYGDALGRPGTVLTFFPWPGAPRGVPGAGQATAVSFSVPLASLGYWADRLAAQGITVSRPAARFEDAVLAFADPDGLCLELIAGAGEDRGEPWSAGPVPVAHGIRGFHSVSLTERALEETAAALTGVLGFAPDREGSDRHRYTAFGPGSAGRLDVVSRPHDPSGVIAVGTVHHVAWRTPDDQEQFAWRRRIGDAGIGVTPVQDRQYFRSIYFREPGGVLFEIATDGPGFAIDESPAELGTRLRLPAWLESRRDTLEARLPRLRIPATGPAAGGTGRNK
jgi:catechol 2,3-dioxygenase-like lactoylglutathione lyase family enzyme